MKTPYEWKSGFAEAIQNYISLKRQIGMKFEQQDFARLCLSFTRFIFPQTEFSVVAQFLWQIVVLHSFTSFWGLYFC